MRSSDAVRALGLTLFFGGVVGCAYFEHGDRPGSSGGAFRGAKNCHCNATSMSDPTYAVSCNIPERGETFVLPSFHLPVATTSEPARHVKQRQRSYVLSHVESFGLAMEGRFAALFEFGEDHEIETVRDRVGHRKIDLIVHEIYVPAQTVYSININAPNVTAEIEEGWIEDLALKCHKREYFGLDY